MKTLQQQYKNAAPGCKPEDVKIYAFSGWKRTPEYTED